MNFKRKEIEKFIEQDLIAEAERQFQEYSRAGQADLKSEVDRLRAEIVRDFGEGTLDNDGNVKKNEDAPKVKLYLGKKKQLEEAKVTQSQISDVFNHIYEFFSRYYDKGDFIPKRRYGGKNKYYIPYNGEEVAFYWATKDMYYVKTGEFFKKYRFKAGRYSVTFVLTEAKVEVGNVKGEKKYFLLSSGTPVIIDDSAGLMEIRFNYRSLNDEETLKFGRQDVQAALVNDALEKIAPLLKNSPAAGVLKYRAEGEKSLLEKHLNSYVERNTRDFFIHKNLKGFLENELDFYLKSEVWNLNELEATNESDAKLVAAKAKAIHNIAVKIIEFLSHIEEFQKMLFEKKKLVIRTDYCLNLDKIPESFYEEIGNNRAQVNEWKTLFKLDAQTKGALDIRDSSHQKLTLDKEFLKKHKNLVVDTKFFDQDFKDRLLQTFNDIDEEITGTIIKSENFHALNLLQPKYLEQVTCIYIDPPYNTGSTKILYKNEYEHSSWVCLIANRLPLGLKMLKDGGILEIAIDDYEGHRLRSLIDNILGEENRLGTITVVHNPGGRHDDKFIATAHEYLMVYSNSKDKAVTYDLPLSQEDISTFKYEDEKGAYRLREFRRSGSHSTRLDRPNMWYPIYYDPKSGEISISERKQGMIELLPIDPKGIERVWRWGKDTVQQKKQELVIYKNKEGYNIKVKTRLNEKSGLKPKSVWNKPTYSSALGTNLLKDILGEEGLFSYPKALELVVDALRIGSDEDSLIIDFFAGSGTTAHAVLKLNSEDDGQRKYILVETEEYFDKALIPRIKKIMYSKAWKDGTPISGDGFNHIFKYMYLEQYEDTLNNIVIKQSDKTIQQSLDRLSGYFVNYMLDYETKESPTRLLLDKFQAPFDYKIKTISGSEEKELTVDLIETFNYLIGMHVERLKVFKNGDRIYRAIFGRKRNEKTVVIWRNTNGLDLNEDKSFIEKTILAAEAFENIFVNGDSYVKHAKPIEPEFKRLMGA